MRQSYRNKKEKNYVSYRPFKKSNDSALTGTSIDSREISSMKRSNSASIGLTSDGWESAGILNEKALRDLDPKSRKLHNIRLFRSSH